MSKDENLEEKPKAKLAEEVVTPKRQYFFPYLGPSIEAEGPEEAQKLAKKKLDNLKKDGDGQ